MLTDLERFVLANNGIGVDVDGKFGFQCVDLARAYVRDVLRLPQFPPVEGAKDIWQVFQTDLYEQIENTIEAVPVAGDLLIWGSGLGAYGHVAIFLFGDNRRFISFDQNFPPGSVAHLQEHGYKHLLGWLRPKVKASAEDKMNAGSTAIDA